jgi:hypothetical protein
MIAIFLVAFATAAGSQTPAQEIDNVAAFARLYGVVRYFYPSDAAAALDWNRFAVHGVSQVRPARSPEELERALNALFTPLGPGIEIAPTLSVRQQGGASDASVVAWQHRGFGSSRNTGPYRSRRTNRPTDKPDTEPFAVPVSGAFVDLLLTPRLNARVPLALSDAEATTKSTSLSALTAAVASALPTGIDGRLADVVVAWNVFRHFYPYFAETGVDWDSRLRPNLEIAQRAEGSRSAQRDALRALVADARDGHGGVYDPASRFGTVPIQLRLMDGKPVVIASAAPQVRVGDVVTTVDGVSATDRAAIEARLASGSTQWKQWRGVQEIVACRPGSSIRLSLERQPEPVRQVEIPCAGMRAPKEQRPDSVKELEPGIWYVDVTRTQMAAITPLLQQLASARGVIFDLRGYPTDAGAGVLPHLISAPEGARWMHVARIAKPFGEAAGWDSFGWNVKPAAPRIAANRVWLTDGRAISYAESVMGYVRDEKLGTIIGSTTAGTNGNVASFEVPGGFSIAFTGMRVTRHDGRSPYHIEGVKPDIPIEPTLAGLRAGRDEVLERALAHLRGAAAPRP